MPAMVSSAHVDTLFENGIATLDNQSYFSALSQWSNAAT